MSSTIYVNLEQNKIYCSDFRFNTFLIKISAGFLVKVDKLIPWKFRRFQIAKML